MRKACIIGVLLLAVLLTLGACPGPAQETTPTPSTEPTFEPEVPEPSLPAISQGSSLEVTLISVEKVEVADRPNELAVRMQIDVENINHPAPAKFAATSVFLTDEQGRKWSELVEGLDVFGEYRWFSWDPELTYEIEEQKSFDIVIWVSIDATGLELHFADIPPIRLGSTG